MKKFLLPTLLLLLVLASTAASAGGNHLLLDSRPARQSAFTLVIDPDGPEVTRSAEALHYLLDRDSIANQVIYGFTSLEGREQFVAKREHPTASTEKADKTCTDARFNKVAYGAGIDWLLMYCGQTNPYVADAWNDVISYVEASGSWTILYKCYYFSTSGSCSTLAIAGGNTINDLNTYGFNNYTSSIKVCPEGITFTECQNF